MAGIGEVLGERTGKSALQLYVEAAATAIADSGIDKRFIDGVLTGNPMIESFSSYAALVGEALGLKSMRLAQSVDVGGAGPCTMVRLAAEAVTAGSCQAVVVAYADNRLTALSRSGAVARFAETIHARFERPLGPTIVAMYALVATRHMLTYGSTAEQFAAVAVQARANAARTPGAIKTTPISVADVLSSRLVASPLHVLDCCLISDFAGALIVAAPEIASGSAHDPIHVLGGGEGHTHAHLTQSRDILDTGARESATRAFQSAGVTPADIDFAELYDCFTIAVVSELEQAGFCEPGEGAAFVASGALAPSGRLPFNTNGGMLSFHNGGIYHVTEAVRQLRREGGARQVRDAELGFVHGNGGIVGHHASLVLGRTGP